MNRQFLLSAFLILSTLFCVGQGYQVQSKYFVYLQTEPAQTFYIKINGQKIDANTSGYLILPQLKDGDYKLTVGFPQGKVEEQVFNFKIDSKDKGYLIKDYGGEGWGLFDLQTMAVQKALTGAEKETASKKAKETPPLSNPTPAPATTSTPVPTPTPAPQKEPVATEGVSDFTKVLSQAANDPTLLEKPKPEPVEEKVVEEKQPETEVVVSPKSEQVPTNPTTKSNVQLQSQSSEGVTLVYDNRNTLGQVDPVTIFIAAPKQAESKPQTENVIAKKKEVKEEIAEPEKGNDDFKVEEKAPIPQKDQKVEEEKATQKITNKDCKAVANEDDFLKLRRAMASQSNDDDMIGEAAKAFKDKCYTTAQIKYLSSMFLANASKYNFYKSAYQHTSDKENFSTLASEISDEGYKEKFNKLLQ